MLTPEQSAIINEWQKGMAIVAGAGCGKTFTLVQKCKALLEKNSKARFAAVSFTEKSAKDLKLKLLDEFGVEELARHTVTTIHGLCLEICRDNPLAAQIDGEEMILSQVESEGLWQEVIATLWLDILPEEIEQDFTSLLDREGRHNLHNLLSRVLELRAFGVSSVLAEAEDLHLQCLARLSDFLFVQYDQLKFRQGKLDFQDLEIRAAIAIQDERVAKSYRNRFDLILVDEFQDTNPVQARLIERITRAEYSNLCVVGDPKQSIYRFRDADLSVFHEFVERIPLRFELTKNFRSRPSVIGWINQVCEPVFQASGLQYEALQPGKESVPDEGVNWVHATSQDEVASFLHSHQKNSPVCSRAILLRKLKGNESLIRGFIQSGIQLQVQSGGLFWEEARVKEMVSFLKWWWNEENKVSGLTFLRSPWVSVSDKTIDAWVFAGRSLKEQFLESEHPIAKALKALPRSVRVSQLLSALLATPEIEASLGIWCMRLWLKAEQASYQGKSASQIVREFVFAMENGVRESDLPPPEESGRYVILTIHGAKGLEFDEVFLLDFSEAKRARGAPILFWDRKEGLHLTIRDEDGERDREHEVEKKWRSIEQQKELEESKRVFYVAVTRAKERLFLVSHLEFNKNQVEEGVELKDHWAHWILKNSPALKIMKSEAAKTAPESVFLKPIWNSPGSISTPYYRARSSVTDWNKLAKSTTEFESAVFSTEKKRTRGIDADFEKLVEDPVLDTRELGTRIHGILEKGQPEDLELLAEEAGGGRIPVNSIKQWWESSPLMNPSRGAQVFKEYPFELQVNENSVLVGTMDRLVQKEDGSLVLVDFKFSEAEKTDQQLIDQYQTQVNLYCLALNQGLQPDLGKISAYLVLISPKAGVKELEVKIPSAEKLIYLGNELSQKESEIISRQEFS